MVLQANQINARHSSELNKCIQASMPRAWMDEKEVESDY